MLRRKPTALTITSEDLTAFEDLFARKQAYLHYRATGEDPNGWFTTSAASHMDQFQNQNHDPAQQSHGRHASDARAPVDPNDELKPLPGDKARIVRGREERIVGGGNTGRAQHATR